MSGNPKGLAIVVATRNRNGLSVQCLRSLAEAADADVDLIVVSTHPVTENERQHLDRARWIACGADASIPELWALGMNATESPWIATTTSEQRLDATWLARLRQRIAENESAAIGGTIAPPLTGGPAAWAVWFLRYGSAPPREAISFVDEIAADNAAYRADELHRHRDAWRRGFWEPDYHRELRAAGGRLQFDSALRATMTDRIDITDFAAQRLHHGRQFGASRVRNVGALRRAARLLSAPLVPVVFWGKIAGRALATPQRWLRFLTAQPFLLLFLTAWSTGELVGYATAREPEPHSMPRPEALNSEGLR